MFKILKVCLMAMLFLLPSLIFAQSGPPAPGTGVYAIIDTTYQVGTNTQGFSKAKITLKNTLKIVGPYLPNSQDRG
jgi:hypothetical protein